MAGESFLVSREDWSLHRKGELDQQRHQEKVREAIRDNLADLVADEALIMSDGQRVIRVPIRSLEEYRFRFDPNQQRHTGQGNGGSRPGDVLGSVGPAARGEGGSRPGDQPGVDYYEAEVTVDELADIIFADLGLPNLKDKKKSRLETDHIAFTDVRRAGLSGNLDKRRTLLEALRRNARAGRAGAHPIRRDDLRFKTWEIRPREQSNAVVFAMMDTSGSMGTFEKYIARSFYFWMVRFLRTRYQNVDIVFIAHDTQAREVDEKAFFSKGESGGTKCSSAYELALQIVAERYPPSDFNIYPFHFSDGDNYPSDNARCLKLARELVRQANAFGYGEIVGKGMYRDNTLMRVFERLTEPNVVRVSIKDRRDVYPALKAFFSRGGGTGMTPREMAEFQRALEKITALARDFGLDPFPMRYEICPADVLYSFGAYGMPTRFSHWSFGKAYYRMKTQYDFNLSRIYELVVNSDPCYAFLLEGNSLLQNKVIAAHVLAHSDFFKHNAHFAHTPRDMMDTMAASAARIREYEFRHGRRRVEEVLDAALALQFHVDPYRVRNPPPRRREETGGPEPETLADRDGEKGDLLLFLIRESRSLTDWERDVLGIVREEMLYFFPQLETKIMNEGWASLWHARIMRALDLPPDEAVEFAALHASVLQPNPLSLNPYRVGYAIFEAIEKRWGTAAIFEVREMESDVSFLRNYLTEELVESLDLYLYQRIDDRWVVTEKDWKAVRDHMVRQASHLGIPRIVAADPDYRGNGELLLVHRFEGEELDQRHVDRTMPHVYRLWGRPVHLETVVEGRTTLVSYDGRIHRRAGDGRA